MVISYLKIFLVNIAGLEPDWFMSDFIEEEVDRIRLQVKDDKVICGLMVALILLSRLQLLVRLLVEILLVFLSIMV